MITSNVKQKQEVTVIKRMKSLTKVNPIFSACKDLGLLNTGFFLASFALIIVFETTKQQSGTISTTWIVIGVLTYTVFASYFGYFFTFLLPRSYRKKAVLPYLQNRAKNIGLTISYVLADLIQKGNAGDANKRDRSNDELVEICKTIEVYQTFPSNFLRNEPFVDFYEYFSSHAAAINEMIGKIMSFSDVLTVQQIEILLELERATDWALTRNIKFSAGTVDGKPATVYIQDSYAYSINQIRRNSMDLLATLGMKGSVS